MTQPTHVSGTIKPLVWVSDPDNDGGDWFHRAWAGEYCYEVGQDHNGWWWQESEAAFNPGLVFATPDAAKAAAQADYEARIAAQIQPAARAEVSVAEAARVLLATNELGGRNEVHDACAGRLKVHKFDAVLRALTEAGE